METALTLLAVVMFLLAEGFFSGAEIGIISADRIMLRHKAAKGNRGAKLALRMLENPEWLLSTTLVGTNISVVANTTLITALVIEHFGENYSWLAIAMVAPAIWILGEIVPKSIFQERANKITPWAVFVLKAASYVFAPILFVFAGLARLFASIFGGEAKQNPFMLREEIVFMMDMSAVHGDIQPVEKDMIRRVFGFNETTAREVMVPLVDVIGVARNETCGEVTRIAVQSAHKRLPVYDERIDNIVGVINVLDLLTEKTTRPIDDFVRPVRFSPGNKSIGDLVLAMRRDGGQTTVIVDEYGGAEGIVLLEDILEEVVGDLEDEFDASDPITDDIVKYTDHDYLISGRCDLKEVAAILDTEFPQGEYETLAGFILSMMQDIPDQGDVVEWRNFSFTIKEASNQAIQSIRVTWKIES